MATEQGLDWIDEPALPFTTEVTIIITMMGTIMEDETSVVTSSIPVGSAAVTAGEYYHMAVGGLTRIDGSGIATMMGSGAPKVGPLTWDRGSTSPWEDVMELMKEADKVKNEPLNTTKQLKKVEKQRDALREEGRLQRLEIAELKARNRALEEALLVLGKTFNNTTQQEKTNE